MATTKQTNPKNTELESDVLKAAGNAAAPVDQQAIKDQAQAIGDQANKAASETVQGTTQTMQGTPAPGIQEPAMITPAPGAKDLPAAVNTGMPSTFGNPALGAQPDPEYLEFLEYKRKKAEALEAQPLAKAPDVSPEIQRKAEEAALKAYHETLSGDKTTPHPDPDGEIKSLNANKLHEERVKMYGPDYVVARRQNVEQVFTRRTWQLLGGRNNTDGYREVVATPPEVENLKKGQ